MKNRLLIPCAVLLCLCLVFGGLWLKEKQDSSELEQLCSYCAYNVYERFSDYRERGSEYAYHYGVAELTAYYNCYSMLMSETEGSLTNRKYLNSLLGVLMDYPELTKEQIGQLVTIGYQLSRNVYDENAYDDVFSLYNELSRGAE